MSRGNGETTELPNEPPLPIGWSWSRLDSVCDIAVGFAFKSAEFATHGIRLLRGENLEPGAFRWTDVRHWPEEKVLGFEHLFVREGDIILAMDRPVISSGLKIAYAKPHDLPCLLVQRMARLRVQQVMTSQFAYAAMQTQRFINHLQGGQTGTQLPHVSTKGIGTFPIPVPPLNEQRRIVGKIEELFSDLEAGVAALTRARGNLKRYRASVLKAAVEGALTAEWRAQRKARVSEPAASLDRRSPLHAAQHTPTQSGDLRSDHSAGSGDPRTARGEVEPASKLLERLLTERRRQWAADQLAKFAAAGKQPPNNWQAKYAEPARPDTTNLPTLPDGWCWTKLDQLLVHLRNGYFQSPSGADHGTPILRINAVRPLRVDLSETRFLDEIEGDVGGYFIEDGDLLFTRYNGSVDLLGVAGMVRGCTTQILHPDKLIRVTLAIQQPLPAFIEIAANVGASRRHMAGRARTTAGQTGISGTDVREMPIPLPPLAEQAEIVATVSEKLSQIESAEVAIEHSLRRAARLRQSILKQAFEGKLVPQDPTDEPASSLLERIKAGNDAQLKTTAAADRTRTRRGSTSKRSREDEP